MCHSLVLCIQEGFEKLPSSLGFMLIEVHKWFKESILRCEKFSMLFDTKNARHEWPGTPLTFASLSANQWAVSGKVIFNVLVNWWELTAYFQCAKVQGSQEVHYRACTLLEIFCYDCKLRQWSHFCSQLMPIHLSFVTNQISIAKFSAGKSTVKLAHYYLYSK